MRKFQKQQLKEIIQSLHEMLIKAENAIFIYNPYNQFNNVTRERPFLFKKLKKIYQ